ncbi:BTB domain-containing protein [Mycena sanguinolenta]|uniref:BTB domain-containing protein n=1 Tax=Mycena sanguinolenta TaxID=230812 RepID=A0A8H6Z1C5_9AGAR|nr:BTB domain-containing protein [Mycena sanguinolenta]
MQELPQPSGKPTVDGSPVVKLQDDPTDVEYLLNALYDGPTDNLTVDSYWRFIRLGRKIPQKPRCPSSPSRLPAKRKRNEAPIKRSELWFSDGSVILQAANTQFRVHLGVLARHSVIFRRQGLVQSSDEPTVDGCPIVRLPDDPTDIEYLLKSLYDPTFHSRPRLPLPVVGALLRLGSKYRFKDLLDSIVARLTAEYPTTLVKYDAVRATFETIEWYFGIEIDVVTLLSETRMFSAFPCACIRLLQLFDLDELFDGTDRSDGTCASLSRTDLRICAIARQKLLYKQFEPGYTLGLRRTLPPLLPVVPAEDWDNIFDHSGEAQSPADGLLCEERLAAGSEALRFVLFLLVSELALFPGKPHGFVEVLRLAVSSRDVLQEILRNLHPGLALLCGAEQLESGFHYFVGYLWDLALQNIDVLLRTLRPIFKPLLKVAADHYPKFKFNNSEATALARRENTRKAGAVAFLNHIKLYQAPEHDNLLASPAAPITGILLHAGDSCLDLENITCLDPAWLERRYPPSPSTPPRGHLPLPQPHGLRPHTHIVWASPTIPGRLAAELGLSAHSPSTPDNRLTVWSLASPSALEAELPLLDLSIERSASQDGLGPAFQYQQPPSPGPVSGDKLAGLSEVSINLNELANKSSDLYSSGASTQLGTAAGTSKTDHLQASSSTASETSAGISTKTSPSAVTSPRRPLMAYNH